MPEFRLSVPVSLCVSVNSKTAQSAKATLKRMLSGSAIEKGISLDPGVVIGDGKSTINPDARLYANKPFEGISVEDVIT